jgi:short-subunit dehydrogenase
MNTFQLAIVTGASSGLGKALCQALAAQNIPLILVATNEEKLQNLASTLSVPCQIYAIDLKDGQERKKFLSWLTTQSPDLIINNAGCGLYGPALAHSTAEQSANVELNVQALLEITLEGARALLKQKRQGTIMNISSAAAFFPYPTHCLYAAAKSFVNQFSEGLDFELKPHGIRILASCPGMIDTAFSFRASGGISQKKKSALIMSPEKAAKLVLKQINRGTTLEVIDWKYKCLVALRGLIPKSLQMRILSASLRFNITPNELTIK